MGGNVDPNGRVRPPGGAGRGSRGGGLYARTGPTRAPRLSGRRDTSTVEWTADARTSTISCPDAILAKDSVRVLSTRGRPDSHDHLHLQRALTLLSAETTSTVYCETRADPHLVQTRVISRRNRRPRDFGVRYRSIDEHVSPRRMTSARRSMITTIISYVNVVRARTRSLSGEGASGGMGPARYRGRRIFLPDR
jgi:hypothetical protein